MAESTLPVAGCLSLRSAAGENIVVCRGKRPLQRNECRIAEFGWYRGFIRPDLYNWGGFYFCRQSYKQSLRLDRYAWASYLPLYKGVCCSTYSILIERHIS